MGIMGLIIDNRSKFEASPSLTVIYSLNISGLISGLSNAPSSQICAW